MQIDLLLFDMDGTILDSSADIMTAANATIERFGYKRQTKEQVLSCVGNGLDAFVKGVSEDASEDTLESFKRTFSRLLQQQQDKKAIIFDGVKDVLSFFKHKKKGVITNRSHMYGLSTLKNTGLYEFFDFVSGVDAAEKIKPSPVSIQNALNFFGIKSSKAMMIGDMTVDIQAGKRAGVYTCAVSYGLGEKQELLDEKPDFFINEIIKLKEIIK